MKIDYKKMKSTIGLVKLWLLVLVVIIVVCGGCAGKDNYSQNEIVMTPGMTITVNDSNGDFLITAETLYKRSFSWAGGKRDVIMWPRESRWYGSFGIYYPGSGNHWEEHDGITRAVLDEGILHFNSMDDLLKYISRYRDPTGITYNDHGLFVSWSKSAGAGGTLRVMVWQFLINGKAPAGIPGSQNKNITVSYKAAGQP